MTLDPHDQLASLDSETFRELRPVQSSALVAARGDHADESDLAIELPTGSGKTLIALLLAHEVMSAGRSAVYLAPTRQLANQAFEEANRLGLRSEVFEAPLADVPLAQIRRVNRGTSLGIFNYWAYFSETELVDPPGILIMDDAHLAEDAIAGRYSVVIDQTDHQDQFDGLVALIAEMAPGYPVVDDLAADRPEVSPHVQLLTFGDVSRLLGRARPLLLAASDGDPAVRYPYRRVADRLDRCLWFVEPRSITIRPFRFPIAREPRFGDAGRRVYLSATMGDLHDLRRRLGTPRLTALALDEDSSSALTGRRHILLFDETLSDEARAVVRDRLSNATPRRVWFCRSHREAAIVQNERTTAGHRARILDRDGLALAWFRRSRDADLVLAARYDGMDFAHDQARLAFFPSAPFGTDPFDAFMAANFPRSGFLVHRLAERLTQALGRMTRGEGDWAVCVVEAPELARILSRREVLGLLPDALAAEIEDAWDRSDEGTEASIDIAEEVLRGTVPIPALGDWRRPVGIQRVWGETWSDFEAAFGDGLDAGTHDSAIQNATRLLNGLGDHPLRSWWLYLRAWSEALSAEHDHNLERHDRAQSDLGSAIRAAGPTTWFGRVAAMANRMGAARGATPVATTPDPLAAFCVGKTDAALERLARTIDDELQSGSHNRVARAWTQVGQILGFQATQPTGAAPTDSRWQSQTGICVFEAKVEHQPGSRITRREVNQLLGQIEEERPSGQPTFGAFLTHMDEYHPDAGNAADGLTIFSLDAANAVWRRTRSSIDEIALARRSGHVPPVSSLNPQWLDRLLTRHRGRVVGPDDVAREWTRRPRQA